MANGEIPANLRVDIGAWLRNAWEYFVEDAVPWILIGLIYVAASAVLSQIPVAGQIGMLILNGPLLGGMFYAAFSRMRGTPVTVGMLFAPMQTDFVPLMLVGVVAGVLGILITVLTCGLGILVVFPMWMFAVPLVLERRLGFWDAMEMSRQTVWPQLLQWLLFGLVCLVVTGAGSLVFGIGLIATIPVGLLMVAVAYRDVFGLEAHGTMPGGSAPPRPPEPETPGGNPGA